MLIIFLSSFIWKNIKKIFFLFFKNIFYIYVSKQYKKINKIK